MASIAVIGQTESSQTVSIAVTGQTGSSQTASIAVTGQTGSSQTASIAVTGHSESSATVPSTMTRQAEGALLGATTLQGAEASAATSGGSAAYAATSGEAAADGEHSSERQNAAARVLTRTRKYDHISPVLSRLHWLPTKHRIDFKILLMTYKALNGLAPQYLSELLSHYSPPRPLRSQNSGRLIIPRISKSTAGGRSFSFLAPKLWNNLPNTVREADTLCQFKSRLMTHLFNLTYT